MSLCCCPSRPESVGKHRCCRPVARRQRMQRRRWMAQDMYRCAFAFLRRTRPYTATMRTSHRQSRVDLEPHSWSCSRTAASRCRVHRPSQTASLFYTGRRKRTIRNPAHGTPSRRRMRPQCWRPGSAADTGLNSAQASAGEESIRIHELNAIKCALHLLLHGQRVIPRTTYHRCNGQQSEGCTCSSLERRTSLFWPPACLPRSNTCR